ncbi:PAS domain-containing protein [Roseiterribacter gracilis]|uniref:PAS domain-containing protein n=1 Tax=Roseiterribacter gracilis TaxID=2812848 RepID=A0A8S8XAC3_9PROT|nr:hypothetical protein TMPK1_31850 [Rhodospirillales bacterium TMPK1]
MTAASVRDPAFAIELGNGVFSDTYALWCSGLRDGALPSRDDIRPPRLPAAAVGGAYLYERIDARFRCRLSGTELDRAFGRGQAGKYLDQMLTCEALHTREALMHWALDYGRPVLYAGMLVEKGREHVPFRRLVMPLRERDGREFLFGLVGFSQPDGDVRPRRAWQAAQVDPELVVREAGET